MWGWSLAALRRRRRSGEVRGCRAAVAGVVVGRYKSSLSSPSTEQDGEDGEGFRSRPG